MRIGVDVGGTYTDAVVLDGRALLAAAKETTSDDIASGVVAAVREALAQSGLAPGAIEMITIGTTQMTNAVVSREGLAPAGVIRLGRQSSAALPIAAKWPEDIARVAVGPSAMVDGGFDYDGAPILPTDMAALDRALAAIEAAGADVVAISSVFATSNSEGERQAAARAQERLPAVKCSLSSALGGVGLHQRENATILNAALLPLAARVVSAFREAFAALSLECPLFLSQNDGTLMAAAYAERFPVFTFSSGPTNSMRGAAYLTGARDAMVVDVGGTTSDIGMLIDGFPRPSGSAVSIGGVLTNFRMPDVLAVGLGGGSLVEAQGASGGPRAVGRDLSTRGRVFGGDTLTATDIAVLAGRAALGDKTRAGDVPTETVETARATMKTMLENGVDAMKTSAAPLPLIAVGGGAFLLPDALEGASEIIRPENAGVANALGAAFAQVGGEAEVIYSASKRPREAALGEAKSLAAARAEAAGALQPTIEIVEIHETPMSYMDEPGAVIRVKAVGDVDLARIRRTGRNA